MKKRIFILVFLFVCMFALASCDPNPNPKEPTLATVEEGLAAVEELNNYSLEIDLKTIYNDLVNPSESVNVKLDVSDDKYKVSLKVEDMELSLFAYSEMYDDLTEEYYIIFNPKQMEMPFDGYVSASVSEIIALLGITPDVDMGDYPISPEIQPVITALEEFIMFFVDLKNEYFDFNETDSYYFFNETGKTAFNAAINKFATSIPDNDVSTEELGIEIDITAKTTEKYLTDLSINLTGKNVDTNDPEAYKVDVKYSKFNETSVSLPENVITLTEFLEILQNNQANVVIG